MKKQIFKKSFFGLFIFIMAFSLYVISGCKNRSDKKRMMAPRYNISYDSGKILQREH